MINEWLRRIIYGDMRLYKTSVRREIRGPINEFKFEINWDSIVETMSSGELSETTASA